MERFIRSGAGLLFVIAVLVIGMIGDPSDTWAQDTGAILSQQIQGSWILVSCINEKDGKKFEVFGPEPRGLMVLTPEGRFSAILMRSTLPKFASNSRRKATAEESQAVVEGHIAYFGKYKVVNEKEGTIEFNIEGSSFPNWDGTVQKRTMTLKGNELKILNPTPAIGSGLNRLIWRRAK